MNSRQKASRLFFIILSFLFLVSIPLSTANAAGQIDPAFNASVYGDPRGTVHAVKIQPDGKFLIGGTFLDVQGHGTWGIARLNADGSVDTSFVSNLNGAVYAIELQSDGKIIVGGNITGIDGIPSTGVKRFNANGTFDTSFNIPVPQTSIVYAIAIQPDDKIVFSQSSVSNNTNLYRYNANGTIDSSFNAALINAVARDIELQTDGKILMVANWQGGGFLRRYNSNGSQDATFLDVNTNSQVSAVKVLPDGKILFGGGFTTVNGFTQRGIARVFPDSSLDLTFNLNNFGDAGGSVNDIELRPDGKILIAGGFLRYNTVTVNRIAQLNADGTLDNSFLNSTPLTNTFIYDVEIQADGKVLAGANQTIQFGPEPLLRFDLNGTLDTNFVVLIRSGSRVYRILQQPDGKILIAGTFPIVNGVTRSSLARLNIDGSVDTSFVPYFNGTGTSFGSPPVTAMALQPDGKILIVSSGIGPPATFVRLNPDGTKDNSFVYGGNFANDIALLPDGKIIVVGSGSPTLAQRINSNGSVDGSFQSLLANGLGRKVLIQPDGKILIGGNFTAIAGFNRGRIARLNADGSLDNTFNPPGGANSDVYDLDLQADGKIVLGGAFTGLNGNNNIQTIGRLNSDGTLDSSFVQTTNAVVTAVKIQPDGKILIGGSMSLVGNILRVGIARLNSNGSVDLSFDASTNRSSAIWDINLQSDGKILVGGQFSRIRGVPKLNVARLLNTSRTLFDYDGDGRADISLFRPTENRWYVIRSSDGGVTQQVFGDPGDVPIPADFDGDSRTDFAVYRPSTFEWWYSRTSDGATIVATWGTNTAIPRPYDFDGDGRADYIFYLPANNHFYRFGTSAGYSFEQFGDPGDKPLIGDWDGDGKYDSAIIRPSTSTWWWRGSSDGITRAVPFGVSTDIPVTADFDGDGKTDYAAYTPSTGVWTIFNTSNNTFTVIGFGGNSGDKPVAADYDGDGKADIAIFRASEGNWYLLRSTAGFTVVQFGGSGDIPTPFTFVP